MHYITNYDSPVGKILLACDEIGLTGLWLENEKYYANNLDSEHKVKETPIFDKAKRWLDIYFNGKEPDFMPPIHMLGTPFQIEIWEYLLKIPYGETTTYGELAKKVAQRRGIERMSAQAVGGAVGHNEISIIIPCHRVVGTNGSLTGYAGSINKKIELLKLEKGFKEEYFVPKHSTAP